MHNVFMPTGRVQVVAGLWVSPAQISGLSAAERFARNTMWVNRPGFAQPAPALYTAIRTAILAKSSLLAASFCTVPTGPIKRATMYINKLGVSNP
jgi:hypothetical protein